MLQTYIPYITVEETLTRLQQMIFRANRGYNCPSVDEENSLNMFTLPRYPAHITPFVAQSAYKLSDFTDYHDIDFIRNAYQGILGREPDSTGLLHYLHKLRAGALSKTEVLGRLRYSPEGRRRNVKIKLLFPCFLQQMLGHLPIVGYWVRWFANFIKMPRTARNLRGLEGYIHWQLLQGQQLFNEQASILEQTLRALQVQSHDLSEDIKQQMECQHNNSRIQDQQIQEQHQQIQEQHQQIQTLHERYQNLLDQHEDLRQHSERQLIRLRQIIEQTEAAKADRGQVGELIQRFRQQEGELIQKFHQLDTVKADRTLFDALYQRLEHIEVTQVDLAEHRHTQTELAEIRLQLLDYRRTVLDQQRRVVALLEDTHARLLAPFGMPARLSIEHEHTFDALYVSFEDRFRGTREQVKATQRIYLPYLTAAKIGDSSKPILDIGCGRGEWLELLREQGLSASGLDLNRVMIHECRGYGLDVMEDDALEYLRRQSANSLGAVTGFHIVEHLSFSQLVALLDETLRVLKTGGIALFETPNPENLMVGAYTFYFDPTHRHPLPPPTLQYLAEMRGFSQVDILRLHPREEAGDQNDAFIDRWFRTAVDYAIVCRK